MNKILIPKQERFMSPQEYLAEVAKERQRKNIEQVVFEPPKIGTPGYGRFRVKYRTPVLSEG